MQRQDIPIENLMLQSTSLWSKRWLLLASGDFAAGQFNAMTVAWGSLGYLWEKPFAQVFVRPSRFTYQFLEKYDTFTLSAFPTTFKPALDLLGTKSGRDGDKITASGLTPQAAVKVISPAFVEAELVMECQKMYWQDLDKNNILNRGIHRNYPHEDYHRIYFGEILAITGTPSYSGG
jgi:flavin reductase (DIM6/NTAB) family NADH-FMN oxidoreductase RutF